MTSILTTITTELIEHADGRPVACVDATAVAVFAYQEPDGTYVIDIYTRDDIPLEGWASSWTATHSCGQPGSGLDAVVSRSAPLH